MRDSLNLKSLKYFEKQVEMFDEDEDESHYQLWCWESEGWSEARMFG